MCVGDITLNYTGSYVPSRLAKILSFNRYETIGGTNKYSTSMRLMFKVIHYGNRAIVKEYFLFSSKHSLTLTDLTPEVDETYCLLDDKGQTVDLLFKPALSSANTIIEVLYSPNKQFFKFNQLGDFEIEESSLTNKILPSNYLRKTTFITYSNNWETYPDAVKGTFVEKTHSNLVELNVVIRNGTLPNDANGVVVAEITNASFRPQKTLYETVTTWNGVDRKRSGYVRVGTDGVITVYGIDTNHMVAFQLVYTT